MTNKPSKTPELSLAVQYGIADPELPRWRIRRWVLGALIASQATGAKGDKNTKRIEHLSLTLRLVGQAEGRELNHTYRGKDNATNVLTFDYAPVSEPQDHVTADIVICTPVLKQEARSQGKPYLHHAAHLVVHGTLHALGYDHMTKAQAALMETLEIEILERWGIKNPYHS